MCLCSREWCIICAVNQIGESRGVKRGGRGATATASILPSRNATEACPDGPGAAAACRRRSSSGDEAPSDATRIPFAAACVGLAGAQELCSRGATRGPAGAALGFHFATVASLLARHGGYRVRVCCDRVTAAFPGGVADAVAFAAAAQLSYHAHTWGTRVFDEYYAGAGGGRAPAAAEEGGVWNGARPCVAVDFGSAAEASFHAQTGRHDYRGGVFDAVEALADAAAGGQTLLSPRAAAAAASGDGVSWASSHGCVARDAGVRSVCGVRLRLCEVVPAALAARSFPRHAAAAVGSGGEGCDGRRVEAMRSMVVAAARGGVEEEEAVTAALSINSSLVSLIPHPPAGRTEGRREQATIA